MVGLEFQGVPVPVGDEAMVAVAGEEGQLGTGRGLHSPNDEPHRSGVGPGLEGGVERAKASVRAKVEHPFLRVKRLFGYTKVRYRGLAKNTERLALLFGLGNLLAAEGRLRG